MKRKISTASAPKPGGSYSQGIRTGNMIFTAGQIGKDPKTGQIVEGIEAQTRQVFESTAAILKEAGASMRDVVKVTVHLADFDDFDAFDAVYRTFFEDPLPVRTTVESGLHGVLIEVDVVAVVE